MEPSKAKDIWDKLTAISLLIASVFVPLVIALVGHLFTNALMQSENKVKYTELAISILREKPETDAQDIRAWAIAVVDQYLGVRMSASKRTTSSP